MKIAVEYIGRCARCHRLIKRGREVRIDGVLYGVICGELALSAVRNDEPWVGESRQP